MHTSIRRTAAVPAVVAALAIALTAFAAPVLAKEALDAQLEAPIARDTPGGTTLLARGLAHDDRRDGDPRRRRVAGVRADDRARRRIHRGRARRRPGPATTPPGSRCPRAASRRSRSGWTARRARPSTSSASRSSRGRSARGRRRSPRPNPSRSRPWRAHRCRRRASVPPPAVPAVDPATTVTPVAAPVDAGPGPLVVGAARPGGRGPRDAGHRPPRPDRRPPAAVRPVARGLTPSCSRVRRKSRRPPRRPSFGAPRPATRRRTGSW